MIMEQYSKDAAEYGKKSSDVELKQVTKIFQQPDTGKDFVAVDHIDLHVKSGEMVTLLGPSGTAQQAWYLHGVPELRALPAPEYL